MLNWLKELLGSGPWSEKLAFLTVVGMLGGLILVVIRRARRWKSPEVDIVEFLRVRAVQKRMRALLSRLAYRLPQYAHARGAEELQIPLLCHKGWIADRPIPLGDPGPSLREQPTTLTVEYISHGQGGSWIREARHYWDLARKKLPRTDDGHLYEAIRNHEHPRQLTSDPCYSLLEASKEGEARSLKFGLANYSEYIDVGEALAYEFAMEYKRVGGSESQDPKKFKPAAALVSALAMRHAAGAWHEVAHRPSLTGINCLTLIEHESGPTFVMMLREHVGSAQNTVHVVPAGEFQPTQGIEEEASRQCRLWQTLLREFAEEILGMAEAEGSDYTFDQLAREPSITAMRDLISRRRLKAWFLGCGLDPLTLKPEILVVLTIQRADLRALLDSEGLRAKNAEGQIFGGDTDWGYHLNREALERMADDPKTLPAGIGCLRLTARHLDAILAESSS